MAKPRRVEPNFGARLRARRRSQGLTQAKLAKLAGVTPNYVGVMERGLKLPTLETLANVAKALNIDTAELLGEARSEDTWLDEMITVATTIPEARRALALDILRSIATSR